MGNSVQALAQLVLGKASLQECTVEEIKHLVQRHPYFAAARFLLLQKLKEVADPQAEAQHQKAVLYYPDPLQFEHFISSGFFQKDKAVLTPQKNEAAIEKPEMPIGQEGFNEANESFADALSKEEISTVQVAITETEIPPDNENEKPTVQAMDPAETAMPEELTLTEEPIAEERIDVTPQPQNAATPEWQNKPDTIQNDGAAKRFLTPSSEADATAGLAFEPYHTVDYFASQGIKPLTEELPKDKLGKGLKSFTEWLKTMKRLPSAQSAATTEPGAEKNIETMANSSVSNMEIVTEAMAEVWAKQGNREKAIETYHKLSLLYPPKKAFFAGKIENLKTF